MSPGWRDEGRVSTVEAGHDMQAQLREVMEGLSRLATCSRLHLIRTTLAAAGRTDRCSPGAHLGSVLGEADAKMLSVISAPWYARTSVIPHPPECGLHQMTRFHQI